METALLAELGIYIFILGLMVQSIYRLLNPMIVSFLAWFIKPPKKTTKIPVTFTDAFNNNQTNPEQDFVHDNQYLKPIIEKDKKELSWADLIVPPLIGLGIAWLFWPLTIFHYLPFQPQFPIVAYIATSLVISRISNAEHDTFKTIGQLFMGLVHRITPF